MTNNEPPLHVELYSDTQIDPFSQGLEYEAWNNGVIAPAPPQVIGRVSLSADLQEVMQRRLISLADAVEPQDLPSMYMPIGTLWEDHDSPEVIRDTLKVDKAFANVILGDEEPEALQAIDLFTYEFHHLVLQDLGRVGIHLFHPPLEQLWVSYGRPASLPGGMLDMRIARRNTTPPDAWHSRYAVTLLGPPAMQFVSEHSFARSELEGPYLPAACEVPSTIFPAGEVVRYTDITPHSHLSPDGKMQLFMGWSAHYKRSAFGAPRAITQ